MQDYPPVAKSGSRSSRDQNNKSEKPQTNDATIWVATAIVIVSLAAVAVFSQDNLKNGGAPFIMTPSNQIPITALNDK